MPTETPGAGPSNVRPTAIARCPTIISGRGTGAGTTSFSVVATFSKTSIRL